MEGRRAPGRLQCTDAQQPAAEVVLRGVADRAVHLQADAGREVGGVGGLDLGSRDGARCRIECGTEDQRAGEVEGDAYVGQLVLDRLVRADRATELGALLHVRDRVGEHSLAGTEQLCGGGEHGEVERARRGRRERRRDAEVDAKEPAARVDRLNGVADVGLVQCAVDDDVDARLPTSASTAYGMSGGTATVAMAPSAIAVRSGPCSAVAR